MANMDYPAPCFSCIEGKCLLPDESLNRISSSGEQLTPFWNHLSSDEKITNVDSNDPLYTLQCTTHS